MSFNFNEVEPLLALAEKAARAGGTELLSRFGRLDPSKTTKKSQADYASEADLAAEHAIAACLTEGASRFGFLGEETGFRAGEVAERWVVDPLDGTSNFIWSIPYFAVSIALCDTQGEILGVVFDPLRDEMFTATRGGGARLNGRPLGELIPKEPADAMVSVSLPIPGQLKVISEGSYIKGLRQVMAQSAGMRRLGSAALDLAYIGAGRLDAFFEDGLSYYDIAAGKLVAKEAGARVSDFNGNEAFEGPVVAAAERLHAWMMMTFGG